MDRNFQSVRPPKTVPIRHRVGEGSASGSTSSDVEGTFIPLTLNDSKCLSTDFVNPKFVDDDDDDAEEVVDIVDLQSEKNTPLFLLFPDLPNDANERLATTTSTSDIAQMLMGKQPDFSLLKPSKKLYPNKNKLASVAETSDDKWIENTKLHL